MIKNESPKAVAEIKKLRKRRTGEWSEINLIEEIQKNPVLYDKTLREYRKPGATEQAWEAITSKLNANVEDCKKRWKSLRDTFIKYYRMEIESQTPLNSRQKTWKYYNNLAYLKPHVELFRLDETQKPDVSVLQSSINATPAKTRQNYTPAEDVYIKSKPNDNNTYKVLVVSDGQTEYTYDQDGVLNDIDELKNDQIYVEPIDTDEYQSESEPEPKKNRTEKFEIVKQETNDPDEKFLMSCLPVLKRLEPRKNALLKLKIQTLLYEIEFGDAN